MTNQKGRPTQEDIQRRAYEIWLTRGSEWTSPLDDWLEAERQLGEAARTSIVEAPPPESQRPNVQKQSAEVVAPKTAIRKQKSSAAAAAASSPSNADTKGCAVSFLNQERDELDETCDGAKPKLAEVYLQPDEEKEAGGES
jgi:hypothetical protein